MGLDRTTLENKPALICMINRSPVSRLGSDFPMLWP